MKPNNRYYIVITPKLNISYLGTSGATHNNPKGGRGCKFWKICSSSDLPHVDLTALLMVKISAIKSHLIHWTVTVTWIPCIYYRSYT